MALKTIHPNSYWAATAGEEVAAAALVGEHDADVAVVGGGFTGLRAALLLAESGAQVTVVEAARMGWGASGRNGGQVNPLLPLNTPQDIARMYGRKFSERIVQATVECADELFNFIHRRQIDCQARQNGWLRVAHCRSAAEKMCRHSERWREAGAQIEFLSGGELSRALGSNFFALGALAARGGCIHPLRYARELARLANSIIALTSVQAATRPPASTSDAPRSPPAMPPPFRPLQPSPQPLQPPPRPLQPPFPRPGPPFLQVPPAFSRAVPGRRPPKNPDIWQGK